MQQAPRLTAAQSRLKNPAAFSHVVHDCGPIAAVFWLHLGKASVAKALASSLLHHLFPTQGLQRLWRLGLLREPDYKAT